MSCREYSDSPQCLLFDEILEIIVLECVHPSIQLEKAHCEIVSLDYCLILSWIIKSEYVMLLIYRFEQVITN